MKQRLLIDQEEVDLGIDLITLISLKIPTYNKNNIPDDLKLIKPENLVVEVYKMKNLKTLRKLIFQN